jgi:hypothetical protein
MRRLRLAKGEHPTREAFAVEFRIGATVLPIPTSSDHPNVENADLRFHAYFGRTKHI